MAIALLSGDIYYGFQPMVFYGELTVSLSWGDRPGIVIGQYSFERMVSWETKKDCWI